MQFIAIKDDTDRWSDLNGPVFFIIIFTPIVI